MHEINCDILKSKMLAAFKNFYELLKDLTEDARSYGFGLRDKISWRFEARPPRLARIRLPRKARAGIFPVRRLRLGLRFQPIGLTGRWVEAYGSESRFSQIFSTSQRIQPVFYDL